MNIVIFGGTRYVGKLLLEKLVNEKKYNICIVSRTINNIDLDGIIHYKCDRNDNKKIKEILLSFNPNIIIDFLCFNENNVKSLLSYINVADKFKHYIMISTFYVYLNNKTREEVIDINNTEYDNYTTNKLSAEYMINNNQLLFSKSSVIRFPYIISADDYTNRFLDFVHKVASQKLVLSSKYKKSFITKKSASDAILNIISCNPLGFVDVSNKGCLSSDELSLIILNFFNLKYKNIEEDTIYETSDNLCLNSSILELERIDKQIIDELKILRKNKYENY